MPELIRGLIARVESILPVPGNYRATARGPQLSARLGLWLAVSVAVCLVTGWISHVLQHPGPISLPPFPAWGYAVTQGLHVTTGLASIPLFAVKLWSVAPRLWNRPIVAGVRHAVERLSVLLLVASTALELATGLFNVAEAYAWIGFSFTPVHYSFAWIIAGAVLVHVGVKLPELRGLLSQRLAPAARGLGRREVLRLTLFSASLVALAGIGDKVGLSTPVGVLAQRSGRGPQGLPVNRTAADASITAADEQWRLTILTPTGSRSLTLAALNALPQVDVRLPIACVEGWSVWADWQGVRLRDLTGPASEVVVSSPDRGTYGSSRVDASTLERDDTVLALRLNGEPLALDHGAPARLIAAGRPGVLQTKWIDVIEVRS